MLSLAVAALLAAVPAQPSATIEEQAMRHVVQEFERVGRRAPTRDAALQAAARVLAEEVLERGAASAVDLLSLTHAVSGAGGFDPSPRTYVVRAGGRSEALATFLARKNLQEEPASHVGVGAVMRGEETAILLLSVERKIELEPFSRAVAKPASRAPLCGRLAAPLEKPEIFVTRPSGKVDRVALTRAGRDGAFCAELPLLTAGTQTVEVLARGPGGPEVVALFLVDVGLAARTRRSAEPWQEPTTLEAGRGAVLERINALRKVHGSRPLVQDASLAAVAQAYSERMAQEGFFAHVSPEGADLRRRLQERGVRYLSAGENLGLASGPLAAHFGIEHSPGHRKNLLTPGFTHAGLGIAVQKVEGREQVILTEVFATLPKGGEHPLEAAYRSLGERRRAHGLPKLERSEVLEQIALTHARRALELDQPRADLPGSSLHQRVFQSLSDTRSTSVDFFVAEDPALVPDSGSIAKRENDRVGVGAVRGDSPTYGKGRYWVVVIYTARH